MTGLIATSSQCVYSSTQQYQKSVAFESAHRRARRAIGRIPNSTRPPSSGSNGNRLKTPSSTLTITDACSISAIGTHDRVAAERAVTVRREHRAQQKAAHDRQHEVGQRTGRRDRIMPARAAAQLAEIDRHRLGIAEHRQMPKQIQRERQDDRAEQIDVRDRIEREASGAQRGIVAEQLRDYAVHHLVQR